MFLLNKLFIKNQILADLLGNKKYRKTTDDELTLVIDEGERKVRFDEQLRTDLDWKKVLDEKRLKHFLNLSGITDRGNKQDLLFNLDAGDFKNDEFYFNQAGILLFGKTPVKHLFYSSIVCALFKGLNKTYILDRKELTGNLLENVEDAIIFLKKHLQLRWEITGESLQRKEILKMMSENPQITIPQLATIIGITTKGIEWQINRLKKDGLIKRIGPSKGGKWEVIEAKT